MSTPRFATQTGTRPITPAHREALYGSAGTRAIEQQAAASLPHHTLMARAGLAVARLALALQPHARCIWVACGPGNNGGDGLVAATHLHRWAKARAGAVRVVVTHLCPDESRLPRDAHRALDTARQAGVVFSTVPPDDFDLAIDALLGIGPVRAFDDTMASWLGTMRRTGRPVLSVDLPSGLHPDTGALAPLEGATARAPGPRHTLALLTLKPGLFTGMGRDAAGSVWFDDLGVSPGIGVPLVAWLEGQPQAGAPISQRPHASHKGSFGDVAVIGGQGISQHGVGMTGAAVLAARAALHAGAGRVFVGLLEGSEPQDTSWDPVCPELMFRSPALLLEREMLHAASVVCGCGGGAAVAALLPRVLSGAATLVLDADALNAIAADTALQTQLGHRRGRGWTTVLTPHPLEAARLLGSNTGIVMADRLLAAQAIAERFGVLCVLKGSGTVLATPGEVPRINPTGNAALATAGTGDVLAGMIGSALARPGSSGHHTAARVAAAVFQHGWLADHWLDDGGTSGLCASRLAERVQALD
ncbi:MAG: NAD(P)H-hydrate dehydratase [Hydrogenophaga sp.]|uniref:NAD(P)H-hydrate dehydratase n=1 Tax=Hydrogenophaga sp. TaxID=1904254 RepID=UPI0026176913|nr:NAD(P)H-hydrate dehydratase [Hydrogenophaga sp.]MCV0438826.1 NAD(P)H-hydrate dehydratase [Hydrogenophaga sp.]